MNEYLSYAILGLVQGATEFLPVSSSGHLLLLETLGVGKPDLTTNLFLHLATLLVVLFAYRKKILFLIKNPLCPQAKFIWTATVPTALFAALIRFFVEESAYMLPTFFAVTSVLLLLPYLLPRNATFIEKKPTAKALFVGLMQGVACFAGISRSGATSSALLLVGCEDESVAEYSFLLSVPVILGSGAVELIFAKPSDFAFSFPLLLGFAVALISGFFALRLCSSILKKGRIAYFSVYTACLALASFYLLF